MTEYTTIRISMIDRRRLDKIGEKLNPTDSFRTGDVLTYLLDRYEIDISQPNETGATQ